MERVRRQVESVTREYMEWLGSKKFLSPVEAVALGYFSSTKVAAAMRGNEKGPTYIKRPGSRIIVYDREELERWVRQGVVARAEEREGA